MKVLRIPYFAISRVYFVLAIIFLVPNFVCAQLKMHVIDVGQAEAILLELPGKAILIDAGTEETDDSRYEKALAAYLDKFFADHPGLNKTLHTVVVSHPHKDHTKNLEAIFNRYNPKNFIDGGAPTGSGLPQLKKVRNIIAQKNIRYIKVFADQIKNPSILKPWHDDVFAGSEVNIRFLSGGRTCNDENNGSLVIRVEYKGKSMLLTGDSEEDDKDFDHPTNLGCGGLLFRLLNPQASFPALLDVDILKAAHHGAKNGTTQPFLQRVTPQFTVISAGNPGTRSTGDGKKFHAFFFGHPNEEAVAEYEKFTTKTRNEKNVVTMTAPTKTKQRKIRKAIYVTAWDGNIVLEITKAGVINLEKPAGN